MSIPKQEYLDRIQRLAAAIRAGGMSGVILTAESNIDYFSGFRHHAPWTLFARPTLEVISGDGRTALITHGFLEPEMRRTSPVNDIRSYSFSGQMPTELLTEVLSEFGMQTGSIGMEFGYEQRLGINWFDMQELERSFPKVKFTDCASLLWKLRMIKSPAEIELMRHSAGITAKAFESCFANLKPGMTEREVARIAAETMVGLGAERPGFIVITSGQGNYNILSGKPTERRIESGDMVWLDMGAVYDGYWSDFCRAAVLGKPDQERLDGQKLILEVNQAAIDGVKPGQPVKMAAQAAVRAFKRNGVDLELARNRIGHGMGLMSTEPPHVALYEETICEEGLVFTIEPRIATERGIYNCEELVVVTREGAEVLTTAPRQLTFIQ